MKVLHVITRMNTGGPAVFLDHLTNSIIDLGVESIIAYGYCESNESDYTDTHSLKAKLVKVKSLHRSIAIIDDIRTFIQVRKIIKRYGPDLVNTHTSKAGVIGRLAAKSIDKKLPVVHTFHGHLIYGYFSRLKILVFTFIERILAKFTDAGVSITQETEDSIRGLGIGKKLQWKVIRLGIPITSSAVSLQKTNTKINLLWVGRFTDIKDPFYAVAMMKELERIIPNQFDLTMVGGGELLEDTKKLAVSLPITFPGWLDQPFKSAGYFDLLVLTSKNEGMGLVMLEAANFGKATVAKNVGGVGEFIENNQNGFLVKGSPQDMAKHIAGLSLDVITSAGLKGREILKERFTDSIMAKNYQRLYKVLLSKK